MKHLSIAVFCLLSLTMYGQNTKPEFDGHNWKAPYYLPIPKNWTIERFLIPISFAPQIPYKGVEDIRFTPGWADVNSDEYWTYTFLWYLDGSPKMNEETISENLAAYYTGLYKINTNLDPDKKVTASFKKITTATGDLETYNGSIDMMDYMQRKPITLNCVVHLKKCSEDKSIVFHELSPKPFSHKKWLDLDLLWKDFNCSKNPPIPVR